MKNKNPKYKELFDDVIKEIKEGITDTEEEPVTEISVPKEIGICVDEVGFLGLLYLGVGRETEGTNEFLALVKDSYIDAYRVEFHENENLDGETFHLHVDDLPVPGEIYYVTDVDGFVDAYNVESYVLYLTYDEYVRFLIAPGFNLPEIRMGNRKWKKYYRVVRVVPE